MSDPKARIALFAASFDPLTNGHLDLIHRAQRAFDEVVVAVGLNVDKEGGTFTAEERLAILREALADEPRVRVETFSGLIVNFADEIGATAIILGRRSFRLVQVYGWLYQLALIAVCTLVLNVEFILLAL